MEALDHIVGSGVSGTCQESSSATSAQLIGPGGIGQRRNLLPSLLAPNAMPCLAAGLANRKACLPGPYLLTRDAFFLWAAVATYTGDPKLFEAAVSSNE